VVNRGFTPAIPGNRVDSVELLTSGTLFHDSFGKIEITEKIIDELVENFRNGTRQVRADIDHESEVPGGRTEAVGWLQALSKKYEGGKAVLVGAFDFVDDFFDKIIQKKYCFTSVVMNRNYRNKNNVLQGATLLSVGVTNTPFWEGMRPILMSEQMFFSEKNIETDKEKKEMVKQLTEILNCDEGAVVAAVLALKEAKDRAESEKIALTEKLTVSEREFTGRLVGKVIMSEAEHQELASYRQKFVDLECTGVIEGALKAGKIVPAQREWAKTYFLSDRKGFDSFLSSVPVIPALLPPAGSPVPPSERSSSPDVCLSEKVKSLAAKEGLGFEDALDRLVSTGDQAAIRYQKFGVEEETQF
jgi:phage I-like protein